MFKSGEGRFNPSSHTFCQKCSVRDGLHYAYANGRDIFLCDRHYDEWLGEAKRNPELVRQIPGRQKLGLGDEGKPIPNQDRRVF